MNEEITVWLDMDGVLVGFNMGYKNFSNGKTFTEFEDEFGKEAAKKQFLVRQETFWADLPWEHGGQEVYETAKKLYKDVRILSSTGTKEKNEDYDRILKGKLEWIEKQKLQFSEVVIVPDRHMKQQFATPMGILVDDLHSNIQEWNKQGGTGILHSYRYYKETLIDLNEYSKPISFSEIAKRASRMK